MPEAFDAETGRYRAVFARRIGPDGSRTNYFSREQYERGKLSSFGNAAQTLRRSYSIR